MTWLRHISTPLDVFLDREIHSRFRSGFLVPLELARDRGWSYQDRVQRAWSGWSSALKSAEAVVIRYPEEAGPQYLLGVSPLADLPNGAKARIADEAMRLFEAETRLVSRCRTSQSQIAELHSACSAIDEVLDYGDRAGMLNTIVSQLRLLYRQLEGLPYGVWIP